jgi:DNA-binding PadR family transcriptional regulator
MTDAEVARYSAVLSWFAKRHPRGSQTSHWNRWLPRAIEEIGDVGIPHDQLVLALEYLHNRGLIETLDGTGSFRGAKVTTITERGYRFLDRFEGEPIDNADIIIAALQAVIAALEARAPTAALHAEQLEALRESKRRTRSPA